MKKHTQHETQAQCVQTLVHQQDQRNTAPVSYTHLDVYKRQEE